MTRPMITLIFFFFGSISFAGFSPSEADMLHEFFKGRRALYEGIKETINSNHDGVSEDAKKIADILSSCEVSRKKKSYDTLDVTVNGQKCQVNYTQSTTSRRIGQIFTEAISRDTKILGSDILTITKIIDSSSQQNSKAVIMPKGRGDYDMISISIDIIDSVNTIEGNQAMVHETSTINYQDNLKIFTFTLTLQGKTFVGTFRHDKNGVLCTYNEYAIGCNVLDYIYGLVVRRNLTPSLIAFQGRL
ncbi:MAG: hypothetical protein A2Z20_11465 [Bdellovibrionales bacterium RBG_16_40_8]|nr:MAG: hypothetical protein A2Z20_11465 [Bdellovibrionales bacterium RBG_16_40_8]